MTKSLDSVPNTSDSRINTSSQYSPKIEVPFHHGNLNNTIKYVFHCSQGRTAITEPKRNQGRGRKKKEKLCQMAYKNYYFSFLKGSPSSCPRFYSQFDVKVIIYVKHSYFLSNTANISICNSMHASFEKKKVRKKERKQQERKITHADTLQKPINI